MDYFSDHIPLLRPWVDDDELNAVLWAMIKGPGAAAPVPVASRFSH